ncbi:MAG: fumarylacetoacetate hydrolase family protein, partial [Planctomycetota bacterium]
MKIGVVQVDHQKRMVANGGDGWFVISATKENPWLRSIKSLIENYDSMDWSKQSESIQHLEVDLSQLCCPINDTGKIVCIGKNYRDHAKEMGSDAPELPVVFNKFPTALIGPNDDVVLPSISDKVDYEAELV